MIYDAIIIGAGLGGLTAGAKLAKEGKKVLLVEQHSKPGGCATTFRRGEFTMEVGLHEMDGPSAGDLKTRIFNELEVFDNVEFIKILEFYHFVKDSFRITIPHDPAEAIKILKDVFPEENDAIDSYFHRILNPIKKSAEAVPDISLGSFIDSITENDNLKLVLLGNLGYFSDDPYSISLNYYSVAEGSYYKGGATYIKGGSQKLSDYLAEYIKNHGGEVLLNHLVTGLVTEKEMLSGITFRNKNGSGKDLLTACGNEIIINAALPNINDLLPEKSRKKLKEVIGNQQPGPSLLTLYLGFKTSLQNIGFHHYSTFVFDRSVRAISDISKNNKDDFNNRSFTFVDYGQIDSGLAPVGKSTGTICCIDYLTDWENISSPDYKNKKEKVAGILISRLEKLIPGVSELIEYYEIGTSSTVKRYTLNPAGAVYGFSQIPGKSVSEPSELFDNLHIASAWGKTGGGFSGAIYSGYLCAYNVLKKRR